MHVIASTVDYVPPDPTSERQLVPIQSTPGPARHLHLRWEGCLSETLELAFLKIGSNTTIELRQAVDYLQP